MTLGFEPGAINKDASISSQPCKCNTNIVVDLLYFPQRSWILQFGNWLLFHAQYDRVFATNANCKRPFSHRFHSVLNLDVVDGFKSFKSRALVPDVDRALCVICSHLE